MSKITYIKPTKHDTDNTTGSVEVHGEIIGNDIDILAEQEQNEVSDSVDEENIFGF